MAMHAGNLPMLPTHTRRIVKQAVMALAAAVLLLSSYVSSWGATWWLYGHGTISAEFRYTLDMTVFYPVGYWMDVRCPGWMYLETMIFWSYANGDGDEPISWNEAEAIVREGE